MMETQVAPSTLVFECIDGKDDRFQVQMENGSRLVLGSDGLQGATTIKELEQAGGCLVVTNGNGVLQFDATGCSVPVKLNGNPVTSGTLRMTDVLKIGNSIWKVFPVGGEEDVSPATANTVLKGHFNKLIGLEELKDFKLKDIFSRVFEKHSLVEMEEQLVTGTTSNTPSITDIEVAWARPWLFSRMLLVSVLLSFVLIMGFTMFENPNLLPGIIFVGSFAVPLSTLIFFLEMNVPRNISIFMMMLLTFVGGVASLIVTLIFFANLSFLSTALGASAAGIIEEAAKLLCVIFILGKYRSYKWVLNGLLFGAAIGTGFAAFESAGYAFRYMIDNGVSGGVDVIILRGILAPFCHIIWTANAAAALWIVKGDQPFRWNMLGNPKFYRVFLSSVLLHMIWNSPLQILPLPYVGDLKNLALGVVGWVITFRLVQQGLKQLNEARHAETERLRAN